MKFFARSFAVLLAVFAITASAQVVMGTGGPKGTYFAQADNMMKVCGSEVTLNVQQTGGSFDNIQGILDNKFTAGITQFDVMRYFEDKDPGMSRIKVLFPLHIEEIHIIGVNKTYREGGFMGFGAKSVDLNSINDLSGRTVVAWGGSVLSAEYFAEKLKINYRVVDLSAEKDPHKVGAKMLLDGQAHAIFAVGGQPLGWLRDQTVFGRQFKLLSIGSDAYDKVSGTYNKVRINYPNLTNGQVQSLGVQALLVTRDYRSGERAQALAKLKNCVVDNIDALRDNPGMHPKWSTVNPAEKFERWANYDPPTSSGPTKRR